MLMRVQQIGRGLWLADGNTKRLMKGMPPTLELWRTKLTKVISACELTCGRRHGCHRTRLDACLLACAGP